VREERVDTQTRAALDRYVTDLFAPEDETLAWIQAETRRNGMPEISLQPHEGRMLQFLAASVGARRAVEIGTLAGYSGTWLARALPEGGKLYTLEASSLHASVARRSFEMAGLAHKVELLEGRAQDSLRKLTDKGPFDFVFIDADKSGYPVYLDWAISHLRAGGMVAAHNAFRGGRALDPQTDEDHQMHQFNRALADHPQLFGTILAVGDGMAAAIKRA
jgi:caffeoyl-CoA O-methyltransferase